MTISKYNRSKITVLSTILIIMVLYIHSYYLEAERHDVAYGVQRFFGTAGLMSVAVQLFFAISGFLFFNNVQSIKDCFPKMKKRVRTLVVPYLIWNVIFVLWYIVLGLIPGVSQFINSDIISYFADPREGVNFLFIEPANFPLWFLRDLIVFVAISPVIYLLIRYTGWFAIPIAIVATYFMPFVGFPYFVLGGCVAFCSSLETLEQALKPWIVVISAIIFVGMSFYVALQPIENRFSFSLWLLPIMGLAGCVTIWRGYDFVVNGRDVASIKYANIVCGYSFFVYLFHEPVFNIIKKLPLKILGDTEVMVLILFFVNPFIMYVIAVGVAKVLKKCSPKLYSILTGGR